jgi:crotonobetainyl-CoA:carnitine CoA-transferase CaiB-like acyl-CoA transferase
VGALELKFWGRLCDALGQPDLKSKHMVNGQEAARIRGELQAIFSAQSSDHWMRVFGNVDCCVTLVLTLEEAIAREQTSVRRMVVECEEGTFKEFAPPLKMSDFRFRPDSPCSRGGTQVVEILSAAGYSRLEIDGLHAAGIVA